MLALIASTAMAQSEVGQAGENTIAPYHIPINAFLLGYFDLAPESSDNPPWAPASCAIIEDGILYKCWCEEIDKPTACVAL